MSYMFKIKCKDFLYKDFMSHFKDSNVICREEELELPLYFKKWPFHEVHFFISENTCRSVEILKICEKNYSIKILSGASKFDFQLAFQIINFLITNYAIKKEEKPIIFENKEKYSLLDFNNTFNENWIMSCIETDCNFLMNKALEEKVEVIGSRRSMYLGEFMVEKLNQFSKDNNISLSDAYYSHMNYLQTLEERDIFYASQWNYYGNYSLGNVLIAMLLVDVNFILPPSEYVLIPHDDDSKSFLIERKNLVPILERSQVDFSKFDEENIHVIHIQSFDQLIVYAEEKIPFNLRIEN